MLVSAGGSQLSFKLLPGVGNCGGSDAHQRTAVDGHMRVHVVLGRGKRAGDCPRRAPAGGHCRTSGTAFACRVGLATWTLPVERETVCLGARILGGAPRPRAIWVPGRWVPRGGGWVYVNGYWR